MKIVCDLDDSEFMKVDDVFLTNSPFVMMLRASS